jgi:hypothetical protein
LRIWADDGPRAAAAALGIDWAAFSSDEVHFTELKIFFSKFKKNSYFGLGLF